MSSNALLNDNQYYNVFCETLTCNTADVFYRTANDWCQASQNGTVSINQTSTTGVATSWTSPLQGTISLNPLDPTQIILPKKGLYNVSLLVVFNVATAPASLVRLASYFYVNGVSLDNNTISTMTIRPGDVNTTNSYTLSLILDVPTDNSSLVCWNYFLNPYSAPTFNFEITNSRFCANYLGITV